MKEFLILIVVLIVFLKSALTQENVPTNNSKTNNNKINYEQEIKNQNPNTSTNQNQSPRTKNTITKIDHNIKHKFLSQLENPEYTEKLTKNYVYKNNRVYRVYTTLFFDTQIIFPENEKITYVNTPIKSVFSFNIIKENNTPTNKLIITTRGTNISTNIIVITDQGKNYNILLTSNKIDANILPTLTVYFTNENYNIGAIMQNNNTNITNSNISKTIYTIEDLNKGKNPNPRQLKDYILIIDKLSPKELKKINLINSNYKIFTNKKIDNPIRVFDDGVFTYFKFKQEPNLNGIKLPAVLSVKNRIEKPTNIQIIYNYMIVKSVHNQFILRKEKEYICIEKIIEQI